MLHFTGTCEGLPNSQLLLKRFNIDFKLNAFGFVDASHAVFVRLCAQRCGFCAMPPPALRSGLSLARDLGVARVIATRLQSAVR